MSRYNLDAIAGQAPSEQVLQAINSARSLAWADPHSLHFEGKQAANLLEVSRESVAQTIGVERELVSFLTSSTAAVRTVVESTKPSAIIHSPIERKVVLNAIQATGLPTSEVFVNSQGRIDVDDLAEKVRQALLSSDAPVLVLIQWANQEIGTIQDLGAIAEAMRGAEAVLMVDATAALGFMPTQPINGYWDFLFTDASSWGGSRVATIFAGANIMGSDDTTSVAEAASAAVGLESLRQKQPSQSENLAKLRTQLESALRNQGDRGDQFDQVDLVDPGEPRLPHVVSFAFPFVDSEALSTELDRQGVAIGSGSACGTEPGETSHVLSAIGSMTAGNVRVSLPIDCPPEAVERLLELLPPIISELSASKT